MYRRVSNKRRRGEEGLEHLLAGEDGAQQHPQPPTELEALLSANDGGFDAAISAAAAAAAAAAVAGVALPPMLMGGGSSSKKKARKAGHPLPVAFDHPDEHEALEAAAAAAVPQQQHRVRSHANTGSDILLLLHDR